MRIGLTLLAALTVQACTEPTPAPDTAVPAPEPQDTSPMAQPADHRVWISGSEGGRSGLIYGTPESDDVALRLACADASGKIEIGAPVDQNGRKLGERWNTTLAFSAGGQTGSYAAQAESNEMQGWAEASTTTSDPLLSAFESTGQLTLDGLALNAETAEERAFIRRFMTNCRPG